MRLKKIAMVSWLSLAASVGVYVPGCSPSDDHHAEPVTGANADVIFEGDTNDEAFEALISATAVQDAAKGTTIDTASPSPVLQGATPPSFTWKAALGRLQPSRGSNRNSARWAHLLGPMISAHAHGTPVNGKVYALVFSSASTPKLLRVFTTKTSYTPDASSWTKLKDAGAPLTVTITSANFDNNRLVQGSTPYVGNPVIFTIQR